MNVLILIVDINRVCHADLIVIVCICIIYDVEILDLLEIEIIQQFGCRCSTQRCSDTLVNWLVIKKSFRDDNNQSHSKFIVPNYGEIGSTFYCILSCSQKTFSSYVK